MIKGIDVVFLHTQEGNLQKWYVEVLGLNIHHEVDGWVEYATETKTRFAVEQVSSPSAIENQPIMISFRVDDIFQAVTTLAARGVKFHPTSDNAIFEAGPSLVATFQDPVGNWLQLSQPRK